MTVLAELQPKEREQFEVLAQQLKADGYNADVVCRKLISQHGLEEKAALELVGTLFGQTPDPRRGALRLTLFMSLVLTVVFVGAGVAIMPGAVLNIMVLKWSLLLFGLGAAAFSRGLIAFLNRDAKEDLREPDKRR